MQGLVLYDAGKMGSLNQCRGLAKALSTHMEIAWQEMPVAFPGWLSWVPAQGGLFLKESYVLNRLGAPKSQILLVSGRQAVLAALALRKRCCTIVLQNPKINPHYFDLVVCPQHDNVYGKNVLSTLGALHNIRANDLEKEQQIEPLNYITVLLGGDSRHYRYEQENIEFLSQQLRHMLSFPLYKASKLLITPSRRTRPELIQCLKTNLTGLPYELWEGVGENPYKKYLANGQAFVVTADSVNMITEACLLGRPVYIFELPIKTPRFSQFLIELYKNNHAAPFRPESLNCHMKFKPLNEIQRVLPYILEHLKEKLQNPLFV